MDKFSELTIFLAVVEKGGFSNAARSLSLSPSAISKAISRQEARLGVRLFNRNSRTVRPTREGAMLYERGIDVRQAMEAAEASVSAFGAVPEGPLRVHSSPMLAKYRLVPLLPAFIERYPQIRLEFLLSVEEPDPVQADVDVIMRARELHGAGLILRRIGSTRRVVCAAPSYLRHHGTPKTPDDLAGHNCLARRDITEWDFQSAKRSWTVPVSGSIASNESELLLELVRAGFGLMRFLEHTVLDDLAAGTLVEILREFEGTTETPIYLAYQHRRHLNPRIRAFVDFVATNFRRDIVT